MHRKAVKALSLIPWLPGYESDDIIFTVPEDKGEFTLSAVSLDLFLEETCTRTV